MNKLKRAAHLATSVSILALVSSGALAYTLPGGLNPLERQKHIAQLPSQTDMNRQREFTVFLRSAASADTVANYFRTFGFQAEYVDVTNSIRLKGSFRQAERAGGFTYVAGRLAITPLRTDRAPSFPAAVQSAILASNFERGPVMRPQAFTVNPINKSTLPVHSGVPGLAPSDYGAIYDINPLYKAGINGKGQTVDIAAAFGYSTSALADFQSDFHLSPKPNVTAVIGNHPSSSSIEPDLDVQRVYGTAPGAAIRMWFSQEGTLGDFVNLFNDIASDQKSHPAAALSVSYGLPEIAIDSHTGSGLFTAADKALSGITGGATQKVALFVSSGDSGDDSGDYFTGQTDVSFFASDSNVLAVGGTTLYLTSKFLRAKEFGWTGSGGGVSNVFKLPPWQVGVTGIIDKTHKNLPDLSNSASPGSPALTHLIVGGFNGLAGIAGTSASSPTMAAITALLKQKRGFPSGGWPKFFYGHAAEFVDIVEGSNGKYNAGKGWDAVTGLGVPDVNKLATAP